MLKRKETVLSKEKVQQNKYHIRLKKDPFDVPIEEKLEVLMQAEGILAEYSPLVKTSYAYYRAHREKSYL